jgi:hypothetical protein
MRDNESVQHPSLPPTTDFSGTQFSTLKGAGLNDPEGPEKYNNTEVKYGVTFSAATQHLTPAVVMYKYLEKSNSSEALKTFLKHDGKNKNQFICVMLAQ